MSHLKAAGGPLGLEYGEPVLRRFFNRSGAVMNRGEFASLDATLSQAEVTTWRPGSEGSALANLINAPGVSLLNGAYPIVLAYEDIADDASGLCLVQGLIKTTIVDTNLGNDLCLPGDIIFAEPGQTVLDCDQTQPIGTRIVGHAAHDVTAGIDVTTSEVLIFFDGLNYLGTIPA